MPIKEILANCAYNPQTTAQLSETFDLAWETLQGANFKLSNDHRKELAREQLAIRVLALTRIGTHCREQVIARAVACVVDQLDPPPVRLRAG